MQHGQMIPNSSAPQFLHDVFTNIIQKGLEEAIPFKNSDGHDRSSSHRKRELPRDIRHKLLKIDEGSWKTFAEIFSGDGALIQRTEISHKQVKRALKYIEGVMNEMEQITEYFYVYKCHTCNMVLCPDCIGQHSEHEYSIHDKNRYICQCASQRYQIKYLEFIKMASMKPIQNQKHNMCPTESSKLYKIVQNLCTIIIAVQQDLTHPFLMYHLSSLCWNQNIQFILGYIVFSSINASVDNICDNILQDNLEQLPPNESFLTQLLTMYDKKAIGDAGLFTHPRMVSKLLDTLSYIVKNRKQQIRNESVRTSPENADNDKSKIIKNEQQFLLLMHYMPCLNSLQVQTCIQSGVLGLYLRYMCDSTIDQFYLLARLGNLTFVSTLKGNTPGNNFLAIYYMLQFDPEALVMLFYIYEKTVDEFYNDLKLAEFVEFDESNIHAMMESRLFSTRHLNVSMKYLLEFLTILAERVQVEVVVKNDPNKMYEVYKIIETEETNQLSDQNVKSVQKQLFFTLSQEQYNEIIKTATKIFQLFNQKTVQDKHYGNAFSNIPYILLFDTLTGILLEDDMNMIRSMQIRIQNESLGVHFKINQSHEQSNKENNITILNEQLGVEQQNKYYILPLNEALLSIGLTWCLYQLQHYANYKQQQKEMNDDDRYGTCMDDEQDEIYGDGNNDDMTQYIYDNIWIHSMLNGFYAYIMARCRNEIAQNPQQYCLDIKTENGKIIDDIFMTLKEDIISMFPIKTDIHDSCSLANIMYKVDNGLKCSKSMYLERCMCSWYNSNLDTLVSAQKILNDRKYETISGDIEDQNSLSGKILCLLNTPISKKDNSIALIKKNIVNRIKIDTLLKQTMSIKVSVKTVDLHAGDLRQNQSLHHAGQSAMQIPFSYYAISDNERDQAITVNQLLAKIHEYSNLLTKKQKEINAKNLHDVVQQSVNLLDMFRHQELLDINLGSRQAAIARALEFFKKHNTMQKLFKMLKSARCPRCNLSLLDYRIKSTFVCLECFNPYDDLCGQNCEHTKSLHLHINTLTIVDLSTKNPQIYIGPYRTLLGECYAQPFDCKQVFSIAGMNSFILEFISGIQNNNPRQLTYKQGAMLQNRCDYESDETDAFNPTDVQMYEMENELIGGPFRS